MHPGKMLAFVALVVAPAGARAADCAHASTQMAMNACAAAEFQAADARLNATFNAVAARLRDNAEAGRLLVAAERAWLKFRDAECAFAGNQVSGGSIAPMLLARCQTALTRTREQQLRAYLDCREGDLSCPLPPK
jgi:uncharacterized protein YecT (DUF1311 family)